MADVSWAVTPLLTAAYLGLYTGYSKTAKRLDPAVLLEVLLVRKSLDHTLVELNKLISLVGLSALCLAFIPGLEGSRWGLLLHAMLLLWVHSAYSIYKYYGSKIMPDVSRLRHMRVPRFGAAGVESMKLAAMLLGAAGQLVLSAGYWRLLSAVVFCVSAVALGIGHFYTMEVDFRGVLQVSERVSARCCQSERSARVGE
jgi:hypothetical protein